MKDRQGALNNLLAADSLGQLEIGGLQQLAELSFTHGCLATAEVMFDRAIVLEPSNARIRQQRGFCKSSLADDVGAIADLDTAVLLGVDNSLTFI